MFKQKLNQLIPTWLLNTAIIFFILILLFSAAIWFWGKTYENKIFPGVAIGKIDLGGKTADQAEKILNQQLDNFDQTGVIFKYTDHASTLLPTVASADADLAYNIIEFDMNSTASNALAYGRDQDFFINLKNQLLTFIFGKQLNTVFNLDEPAVQKALSKNFSQYEAPAQNAQLIYNQNTAEDGAFSISHEKSGQTIDYKKGIISLEKNLTSLNFSPIILSSAIQEPQILEADALNAESTANQYLALAPITLTVASSSWPIEKNQLGSWLGLETSISANNTNQTAVGLNRQTLEKYLQETIATKINQAPADSRFKIVNGRVSEFKTGTDGLELDINASINKIDTDFIKNKNQQVELVTNKLINQTAASSTDNLGITEIIGTGYSKFSGSPKNRRINIAVGANSLSGLLIKPGEVFSVMQNLGSIDASNGYLQELVIKGNKTLPEYGGGLCQIGTTMFRAALASGLPINERRNHSYRVAYYEPAGTDATIYDPSPDLKFTNDTNNYILIQSRISGDSLYFDFWGTKDGRAATSTYPVIYNIVKPKPAKIIETTDLKPGVKKCTEKAHNGADAYFNYQVTYANGDVKTKKFTSHYTPWQEVCLIGVDKISSSTASTTTPISTSTTPSTKPTSTTQTNP